MLEPIGFWSYARHDDEHSHGDLSALRVHVGAQLNLLYGDDVRLWQDVTAIPFGADWNEKISEALNQTTFFIPIMTPRFFKSKQCVEELMIFRRRETALNRKDLVFPFQYVDISDLGPEDTPFPEALAFVRSRQIFDFEPFRGTDHKEREVRLRLSAFAAGIRKTLRSPVIEMKKQAPGPSKQEPQPVVVNPIAQLRSRAEEGDAGAQFDLGWKYDVGEGVEKNYNEAAAWFRKAAEQGDADAQNELAYRYENGLGVEMNDREAAAWYRKAAEQGDAHARFNLGYMYGNGQGVEKNDREAAAWYRKAAEQGDAHAQFNLGVMYENGQGVTKDKGKALEYFQLAAAQGVEDAQEAVKRLSSKSL